MNIHKRMSINNVLDKFTHIISPCLINTETYFFYSYIHLAQMFRCLVLFQVG